jgi:inorganic pyrophosphatase
MSKSSDSPSAADTADVVDVEVEVEVEVEVPRFAFVKRFEDGTIDFVSPLPTPFNYGAVPGSRAPDGDRIDVVLLGARCPAGTRMVATVHGIVHFVDAGEDDPKLVVGPHAPTPSERAQVRAFFAAYARAKSALNWARGKPGATYVRSVDFPADPARVRGWLAP